MYVCKTVTPVHYHASEKYTTFTTIRFITFTVSHIHTVTEPSTHHVQPVPLHCPRTHTGTDMQK